LTWSYSRHISVVHLVHWLIHLLHELISTRDAHLWELLAAILWLGCSVHLQLLIHEVWIHEHLLVWERHLIWHHHATRKLVHLTHVQIHGRRHALRSWHLDRISWSFVIHVLTLGVLSQFSFTMGIGAFTFVFAIAVYNKIKCLKIVFL
jgi:hypothetical protein